MRALTSRHGYAIPCRWDWQGQKQVVIICHGFGSSKDSPMAQGRGRRPAQAGHGDGAL